MNEDKEKEEKSEDQVEILGIDGRVHKVDRWRYNDKLSELAGRAIDAIGRPELSIRNKRFAMALSAIQMKRLPLRDIIDKEVNEIVGFKCLDMAYLKKQIPYWTHRCTEEEQVAEQYEEQFLSFLLALATQAGFTIYQLQYDQQVGGGGVGFDKDVPTKEL